MLKVLLASAAFSAALLTGPTIAVATGSINIGRDPVEQRGAPDEGARAHEAAIAAWNDAVEAARSGR